MGDWLADEPIGLADIAERTGVQKATLTAMRGRDQLPKPRGLLSERAPWWYADADVLPWALDKGYVKSAAEWRRRSKDQRDRAQAERAVRKPTGPRPRRRAA